MKCPKCGSDDITQSKGKCNECLWIYEQEQKKEEEKEKENGSIVQRFRTFGF